MQSPDRVLNFPEVGQKAGSESKGQDESGDRKDLTHTKRPQCFAWITHRCRSPPFFSLKIERPIKGKLDKKINAPFRLRITLGDFMSIKFKLFSCCVLCDTGTSHLLFIYNLIVRKVGQMSLLLSSPLSNITTACPLFSCVPVYPDITHL